MGRRGFRRVRTGSALARTLEKGPDLPVQLVREVPLARAARPALTTAPSTRGLGPSPWPE